MWQDVCLAVNHDACSASEFVSTVLDAPGAAKPSDPPCQPQGKRKAAEMERSHHANLERSHYANLACLFSKTKVMVLRFYQNGRLSQKRGQEPLDIFKHPDFRLKDIQSTSAAPLLCTA